MIPYFDSPVIHLYGPIAIHLFGVMVALGILIGAQWTRKRAAQLGYSEEKCTSMITTTLVSGFIFAHLFDVVAYQSAQKPTLIEILNPFGGLSSFGGFIGALGGLFFWSWKNQQPVMPYADSLGYGLSIGWMFGRLGCFSAHDHPGKYTNFVLGVRYPGGARHDLGLDEALWAAGIALLFYLLAKKNRPLGLYVITLSLAYAPVRFGLDFLRARDVAGADPRYSGLTPAQWGSLAVLSAGVGLLLWLRNHRTTTAAPSRPQALSH